MRQASLSARSAPMPISTGSFSGRTGRMRRQPKSPQAVLAAEASKDPLAIARAKILEATHSSEQKADLQRASRLLAEAAERLFPAGPYLMQKELLLQQANVAFELGRLDGAR